MNEKKLLEIYHQASDFFYNNSLNFNQKSKHWKRYNLKNFNLDNLINFRKEGNLSKGLDDQDVVFSFKIFSDIVNKISESYILKNLPVKNVGNSDLVIPYKERFIDFNKLIHIYWFWVIENKIFKNNKIENICEIGGGFGSFSELFIKNYNSKIFLIDLPEANLMSAYYLKEHFPQKKFFLFDNYRKTNFLSYSDFNNNDIIILPPNCNIDKEIKINFFINTRSMMEMNHEVIKSYFNFIQKYLIDGGHFLNVNRYEKNHVGEPIRISEYPYDNKDILINWGYAEIMAYGTLLSEGYPIRISEYPYDNYWKVIISEPSYKQNWIHFLLCQRSFNNNKPGINEELNNIKKIGKKFYGMYSEDNYDPGVKKYVFIKNILTLCIKIIPSSRKFFNYVGEFLLKLGKKLKNL